MRHGVSVLNCGHGRMGASPDAEVDSWLEREIASCRFDDVRHGKRLRTLLEQLSERVSILRQSRRLYGESRSKRRSGAFVAHANFPFGAGAYERLCPTFASLSGKSGDFHRLNHLCHSPTFKNRKPWHTPGNVKLLLPPRQSRGFSPFGNRKGKEAKPSWRSAIGASRCLLSSPSRSCIPRSNSPSSIPPNRPNPRTGNESNGS